MSKRRGASIGTGVLARTSILLLIAASCVGPFRHRDPLWEELSSHPAGSFARVEVTFGLPHGSELDGFEAGFARIVGAPVHRLQTSPGVRYWADLPTPQPIDLVAIHALAGETPARAQRLYEMYLYSDWSFVRSTAVLRGTGQRFAMEGDLPRDGCEHHEMSVHWKREAIEPVVVLND